VTAPRSRPWFGAIPVLLACWNFGAYLLASPVAQSGAVESALRATVFVRVIGDLEVVAGPETARAGEARFQRTNVEIATGSGVLISSAGQVLTCHHVVSDEDRSGLIDGVKVRVTVKVRRIEAMVPGAGGADAPGVPERYEAAVIASNPDLDLAVLSIGGATFPPADLGDSDVLEPGDGLDAVGFPYGQEVEIGRPPSARTAAPSASISHGGFSAFRTDAQGGRRFIQTSAAVNPGNSGGPVVDADGYVVGIVSRSLASAGSSTGIGFAIPINLVKEFLEASGLDGQLPARRLALGPVQALESKGLRLRLPWGVSDVSPLRTRVDSGSDLATSAGLRIDRVVSPWDSSRLAEAMTARQALESISSAGTSAQRNRPAAAQRMLMGHVTATWPDGTAARMEYAVVELGQEKILARFVGPPNVIAYNASVFRASLASIEADALRKPSASIQRPAAWTTPAGIGPSSPLAGVVVPAGWVQEPDGPAPCQGLQAASEAIAASPVADFTRSIRAGVIRQPGVSAARAAGACGSPFADEPDRYQRTLVSFGTRLFGEGRFVQVGPDEVLHYEVIGPAEQQAALRELFTQWLARTADVRRAPER